MRIFLAGASGVIGVRLIPLLVSQGHVVAGMTRSPEKVALAAASSGPSRCSAMCSTSVGCTMPSKASRRIWSCTRSPTCPTTSSGFQSSPPATIESALRAPSTCSRPNGTQG